MNVLVKRITNVAAAAAIFAAAIPAVSAADIEYTAAVSGAFDIEEAMIFGIDDSAITAKWLKDNLFTYDNVSSNEELDSAANSNVAMYTIDLGEETVPVFSTYRTYIAEGGSVQKGGITIYGSNDDASFTVIGEAQSLVGGEWNDIELSYETAFRYIKVETETVAETDAEEEDENVIETTQEDESEEETDESTTTVEDESDEPDFESAAAVKTVFIVRTDDEEADSGYTTQMGGGVGAAGGLGFYGSKFPDCRGHWAEQIIVECTDKKYLDGYEDGNFRPDAPVTAAEFAKIFSAWQSKFYIVNDGYWAMPYIRDMLDDEIFENGDFSDYGKYMTREECAKAIVRSLKAEYFPSNLSMFEQYIIDIDKVDSRYKEYVLKSYISGIITGYDDGTYNPKGYVTRAEILTLINRAMNEDVRVIPEVIAGVNMGAAKTQTYYNAAVQVRKNTSANSMNFRLLGKNAQYMTEDDPSSGLKLVEEFQGAQGMAFLMRFDISDIIARESELESVKLIINRNSNGDMPLGLFWYENKISSLDWNDLSYMKVVNNNAVAGDNKGGYNAVCDNISAILPTWGKTDEAVPQEEKTQPFAQAALDENNQYIFDLDLAELKAHMDENNIVEFFSTSVNYDRYGMEKDNKPRCYVAGEKAPQLYSTFNVEGEGGGTITLMPEDAEFIGGMLDLEDKGDFVNVANFRKDQTVSYTFEARSAGKYKLTVYYSANVNSGGGTATIKVNDTSTEHEFKQTGSWTTFVYEDLGTFELKDGENVLTISDKDIPNTYLINIRDVVFEKVE